MLEGKPAGESEQVTMEAIKAILVDADLSELHEIRPSKAMRMRKAQTNLEATLQPVTEVEARMSGVQFSAAPAPMIKKAPARPKPAKLAPAPQQTPIAKVEPAPEPEPEAPVLTGKAALAFVPLVPPVAEPQSAPAVQAQKATPKHCPDVQRRGNMDRLPRKLSLLLLILTLLIAYPLWIIGGALLWLFTLVGLFLTVGARRIWAGLGWAVSKYTERRPSAADQIYTWLDTLALRWDALLDMFPDGMVDTLYMPDFADHAKSNNRMARH